MTTISSITELLSLSDSQYRIFDIGRKIQKISKDSFSKIELNQQAYPYPIQAHACIAIVFWQKGNSSHPYIWFVKLPLDEKGLLNQGARNHYLAIIIEALGKNITQEPSSKQEELLKENPYHFTPVQYKMAALNSMINKELNQSFSQHFDIFSSYIKGSSDWTNWQDLGVQGINDYAANITKNEFSKYLIENINCLPQEVLTPLGIALENYKLPYDVVDAILQKLNTLNPLINNEFTLSLIRSLSSSCENPKVRDYIITLINNDTIPLDVLIVLSGRFWTLFENETYLLTYFERIAKRDDLPLFGEIFKDLVAIPQIRNKVLDVMRSSNRSESLSVAIGHVFNTINRG